MSEPSTNHSGELKKTALYDLHIETGAKMVSFAGYHMPLSYQSGIIKEHLHTRQFAGLFDISHMGQIRLSGEQAGTELEKLVPGNIQGLKSQQQRYSVFTNQQGGILDDLIVSRIDNHWSLVVNAVCKHQDYAYLCDQLSPECSPQLLDEQSLLALQGPAAATILRSIVSQGCVDIPFMASTHVQIDKFFCQISRCGYTGEDGYEISVSNEHVQYLAQLLLQQDNVQLIGLGARDTLRLEAGLCLYGDDIDSNTTPVEAGLGWVIDQRYLSSQSKQADFPGAQKILNELQSGTRRQRVGIIPTGRTPVRKDAVLYNQNKEQVGKVTSGGFGPTIGKPIAMAYVDNEYVSIGTQLSAKVRAHELPVQVVPLPFVAHRYYRA